MSDKSEKSCHVGLASAQHERGPTDKNSMMDPQEKKYLSAIEERCGKAGDPQHANKLTGFTHFDGPGKS